MCLRRDLKTNADLNKWRDVSTLKRGNLLILDLRVFSYEDDYILLKIHMKTSNELPLPKPLPLLPISKSNTTTLQKIAFNWREAKFLCWVGPSELLEGSDKTTIGYSNCFPLCGSYGFLPPKIQTQLDNSIF